MKFNQLDIAVVCLNAKFVPAVANAWQHSNPQYTSIAHLNSRLPAFKLFLPLKILHISSCFKCFWGYAVLAPRSISLTTDNGKLGEGG